MGLLLGSVLIFWGVVVVDGLEDSIVELFEWWMEFIKFMNERKCLTFYRELEFGFIFN